MSIFFFFFSFNEQSSKRQTVIEATVVFGIYLATAQPEREKRQAKLVYSLAEVNELSLRCSRIHAYIYTRMNPTNTL